MDEDLYDEFGNYIGPEIEDDSGSSDADADQDWDKDDSPVVPSSSQQYMDPSSGAGMDIEDGDNNHESGDEDGMNERQIVLHDDKDYYPSASSVYPEAEVLIEEEDTQPLDTPIIAPIKSKTFMKTEPTIPETSFSYKYMAGLMDHASFIRNFALIGHLHHGKTSVLDLFVKQTHAIDFGDPSGQLRYSDSRLDEQKRGISIKSSPMSLVMPTLYKSKNYLLNIYDTPGHVNFSDEQTAALRICDGAVVVIDAVEGVMVQTRRSLIHAATQGLPICVVLNKVDRLILELKLPPTDAYLKLRHTLEEVNKVLDDAGFDQRVSPVLGNVCFASALHEWIFSIQSFAKMYSDHHDNFDGGKFAQRLWGDIYFNEETRKFSRKGSERSFVTFILEPLYKMYSFTLGSQGRQLGGMLSELGITLKKEEFHLDPKPLLKAVFSKFFGDSTCFTQMVVESFKDPISNASEKVSRTYTGNLSTSVARSMLECDKDGPLMMNIVKLYPRADATAFDSFGRVLSGTIRVGDRVKVLGEGYSLDDTEDMNVQTVSKIWVYQGRYRVEVNRVTAGNWALLEGVDTSISKTATLTALNGTDDACIFSPLRFNTVSPMKIAIEPINPSELPKMLDGLRKINKTYPLLTTRVEESGEHVVQGTGELYLDCALHDLRRLFSEIEIKVADPVATLCETVVETSSMKCFADTPNQKNRLTMIASPLEKGVSEAIERGTLRIDMDRPELEAKLQEDFGWDILAARSIWHFGPEDNGPNVLVDDTLSVGDDQDNLNFVKNSIAQGFQWATREGPLCYEPMRDVKFKLIGAKISDEPIARAGGQIIPTARRVSNSAFLLATPRLMEPIYSVEIQAPADCVSAIYNVLDRRRGLVTDAQPKPGTPFFVVTAFIPVMDSFGFETDLRTHTQGQAFCLSVFDHYELVPGDPLDKTIVLRPLEPAPMDGLAREFMVKTRRRKGLSEDVSINKFFEDSMLLELAKQDQDLQNYFQNI